MRSGVARSERRGISRLPVLALASGALLATLCGSMADAGITTSTGAVNVRTAPTGTLNASTLESNTNIEVWFERVIVNPGAQSLDHVGAGLVDNPLPIGLNQPNPRTITVGEALSYFIHVDQVDGSGNTTFSGSITFSAPIIGVWYTGGGLGGGDAQWAPGGLTYGNPGTRGWELSAGTEDFTISADFRTLTINNSVGDGQMDQIRVLVNPEPGSGLLAGLGVLGLAAFVRRRRKKRRRAARAG